MIFMVWLALYNSPVLTDPWISRVDRNR